MYNIKHSSTIFEKLRDAFLASIFTNNYTETETVYNSVLYETIKARELSENDQKTVNQVQHAFSHFLPDIKQNCSKNLLATNKKLRKTIANIVRKSSKNNIIISYDNWKNKTGFSEQILEALFKTTTTLQITTGCSNYCRRCNEWAIPGPRKHFAYNTVIYFTKKIFTAQNSDFTYYCASDPLDWQDGSYDITHIINFLSKNKLKPKYGFLTKAPKGKDKLLDKLIRDNADISVSVTALNKKRIQRIEEKAGKKVSKQHEVDKLLIPACLDEDFSSVKSTITDNYGTEITPDGAYMTIPAFTSALNLTGQQRIPITPDSEILLSRKTGRNALPVVYFKPLEVIDLNGNIFRLKSLLPVQVENLLLDIDSEIVTPPGIMNIKEYFKVFEPNAINRRKKMIQTVVKNFKKECLLESSYKAATKAQQNTFKHRVGEYLKFCKPGHVESFKIFSFSFFLNSIALYLKENHDRKNIILHLRKNDKTIICQKLKKYINKQEISLLIKNNDINSYDLFQLLYFRLLDSPDDDDIHSFIKQYPSKYDADTDMICGASL